MFHCYNIKLNVPFRLKESRYISVKYDAKKKTKQTPHTKRWSFCLFLCFEKQLASSCQAGSDRSNYQRSSTINQSWFYGVLRRSRASLLSAGSVWLLVCEWTTGLWATVGPECASSAEPAVLRHSRSHCGLYLVCVRCLHSWWRFENAHMQRL